MPLSAWVEHGEVQGRAGDELAHIHIAAEGARRPGAEAAMLGWGDAHHAAERAQRNYSGSERPADFGFQVPMEEIGLSEALVEKAEAGDDAGPSPPFVRDFKHIDLQYVARLGAFNRDGAGKRVNAGAVDGKKICQRRIGADLASAGVEAPHVDDVAGCEVEPRFEGVVPHRVGRLCA